VPRSDLVLFVTSADRPFTESERGFLEQIRAGGRRSSSSSTRSTCCRTPWTGAGDHLRQRERGAASGRGAAGAPVSARRPRKRASRTTTRCGRRAASRRWTTTCSTRWTRRSACG
jgi:hypothetical protein